MKILHIASRKNNPCCGVSVAVPQHIIAQQQIAKVAFLNLIDDYFLGIKKQFKYNNIFDLHKVIIEFGKPDLVVFHECYRIKYLLISLILRKNKIPYIIIPHGELRFEAQNNEKWLKKRIANYLFFNHFIKHASAIQCLSNKEKDLTLFDNRKIVCSNGIMLPKIIKNKYNFNTINLIFIGRLDLYTKGLDLLLEAINICFYFLKQNKIRISIYGSDFNGQFFEIKKIIENKNIQSIVGLNHEILYKEKIDKLLENDVFIQTSRTEGMPMGILEAMSYGLPCLITRGTSLGELVEKYNAGWVCETNSESIANCIIRCIKEKKLLKEKGQNARKLIEQNFTWDKISKITIETYKKIIKTTKEFVNV